MPRPSLWALTIIKEVLNQVPCLTRDSGPEHCQIVKVLFSIPDPMRPWPSLSRYFFQCLKSPLFTLVKLEKRIMKRK